LAFLECFLNVSFKVAMAATTHLTPVTLELGGKDPAVILPGTNLEQWASTWMRGV
jgi:acyl-CoA reductase-like NAD-dependent aldehyde dehydrogenase